MKHRTCLLAAALALGLTAAPPPAGADIGVGTGPGEGERGDSLDASRKPVDTQARIERIWEDIRSYISPLSIQIERDDLMFWMTYAFRELDLHALYEIHGQVERLARQLEELVRQSDSTASGILDWSRAEVMIDRLHEVRWAIVDQFEEAGGIIVPGTSTPLPPPR